MFSFHGICGKCFKINLKIISQSKKKVCKLLLCNIISDNNNPVFPILLGFVEGCIHTGA